jgi:roadblock/LC7 domain-containing protein
MNIKDQNAHLVEYRAEMTSLLEEIEALIAEATEMMGHTDPAVCTEVCNYLTGQTNLKTLRANIKAAVELNRVFSPNE